MDTLIVHHPQKLVHGDLQRKVSVIDGSITVRGGLPSPIPPTPPPGPGDGWRRILLTVPQEAQTGTVNDALITLDLSRLPADFWTRVGPGGGELRITEDDGTTLLPAFSEFCDILAEEGEITWRADLNPGADTDFYIYYGGGDLYNPPYAVYTDPEGEGSVYSDMAGAYPSVAAYRQTTGVARATLDIGGGGDARVFHYNALSGDINDTVGLAYDGTAYFTVGSNPQIQRHSAAWAVTHTNASPLASVPAPFTTIQGCCVIPGQYLLVAVIDTTLSTDAVALVQYSLTDLSYIGHEIVDHNPASSRLARDLCYDEALGILYVLYTDLGAGGQFAIGQVQLSDYSVVGSVIVTGGGPAITTTGITIWRGYFVVVRTSVLQLHDRAGLMIGAIESAANPAGNLMKVDTRGDDLLVLIDNGATESVYEFVSANPAGRWGGFRYINGSVPAPTWFTQTISQAPLQITGDLTIYAEVNVSSLAAISTILCMAATGETEATNALYLFDILTTGAIRCFHENGAGGNNDGQTGAGAISINTPTNIICIRTVSANTYRFIVNGVDLGTFGYVNDPTGGASGVMGIGHNTTGASDASNMAGAIGRSYIWNSAMSAAWGLFASLCYSNNAAAIEIGTPEDTFDPT